MLGPWCRNVLRSCHEVASLHAGMKSGVQCLALATKRVCIANEMHWARCTEVLRVAMETLLGLTSCVAACVICRLGAACILAET
jgi:hypothetical protein